VILEPRRRIDQALYAVVMEAYVNGVSTRAVDDLVTALGIDSGISKSEVSRICAGLDETVAAFRSRPLHHTRFPYLFLDATYLHVRRTGAGGQLTSMAVVIATGVTATGGREVLGVDVGDSEDEVFGAASCSLKERGLQGTQLVISDQHSGLVAALRRILQGPATSAAGCTSPGTCWRCVQVPQGHGRRRIPHDLRPTRRRHVAATWDSVRDQLAAAFPKIGPLMDEAKTDVLAFTAFPRSHWPKVWSTTRWNGSTRRSNAEPVWSASFPTSPP
jgi:putative transposase